MSELPYPGRRAPRRRQSVCCGGPRGSCKVRRASGRACGAARRFRDRRGVSRRGAWQAHFRRAVGVCALAAAARALPRRHSERLRRAGSGGARLARGSMRPGKPLRNDAARVPHLCLSGPNLAGARRVDFRLSARLVTGAVRFWVCLRRGAALLGSAQRRTARGGLACAHWLARLVRC